ncbi:MAG: hypothetical protein ACHQCF_00210 [Solirubrobacterales bacterium]
MSAAELLPCGDERSALLGPSDGETWDALLAVIEGSTAGGGSTRFARMLGCAETGAAGPRPLASGLTVPDFRVTAVERPRQLALAGRHRFSKCALVFRLEDLREAGTGLWAETRADLVGLGGTVYRGLVIGSRIHVAVPRWLLDAIGRGAERA